MLALPTGNLTNPAHYNTETRETTVYVDDGAVTVRDAHKCGGVYCRDIPLGWYTDEFQHETLAPVVVLVDEWDNDDDDETTTYVIAGGYRDSFGDDVILDLDNVRTVTDYCRIWYETDAAIRTAHDANSFAERVAEREREYQRAFYIRETLLPDLSKELAQHRRDAIRAQVAGLSRLAGSERRSVREAIRKIRSLREELQFLPETG